MSKVFIRDGNDVFGEVAQSEMVTVTMPIVEEPKEHEEILIYQISEQLPDTRVIVITDGDEDEQ